MNKQRKGRLISGHFLKVNIEERLVINENLNKIKEIMSPIKDINKISEYDCIVLYIIMYHCDKYNTCKLSVDDINKYVSNIKFKFNIDKKLFHASNTKRRLDNLCKYKFIYINESNEIILSPLFGTKSNTSNLKTINEKLPIDMQYHGIQDTFDGGIIPKNNNPIHMLDVHFKNTKYNKTEPDFHGTRQIKQIKASKDKDAPVVDISVKYYTYRDFIQLNLKKQETEELIAMAIKKELDLRYFLLFCTKIFKFDNSVSINRYALAKIFHCSKRTLDEKIKQLTKTQVFKKEQMESDKKKQHVKKHNLEIEKNPKSKKRPLKKLCNKIILFFNVIVATKTNSMNRINFWGKSLTNKDKVYPAKEEYIRNKIRNIFIELLQDEEFCEEMGLECLKRNKLPSCKKTLYPKDCTFDPDSFWYGVLF